MALQIDEDVNAVGGDALGGVGVGEVLHVDETVERSGQPAPHRTAVIGADRVAEDRPATAIVFFNQLGDQPGGRVSVEIGGEIPDGYLRLRFRRRPTARRVLSPRGSRLQPDVHPLPRGPQLLFRRGRQRECKEAERRHGGACLALGASIADSHRAGRKGLDVFPAA